MIIVAKSIWNIQRSKLMTKTNEIAPHAIVEHISIKNYPMLEPDYYLKLALFYAEKGFFVFPVNPNKSPYQGFHWSIRASNKPDKVRKMWQEYPNGRPAIFCKASDILIIDTDNKPEKDKNCMIFLYVEPKKTKNKQEKLLTRCIGKRLDLWLSEAGAGERELNEGSQSIKLSIKR